MSGTKKPIHKITTTWKTEWNGGTPSKLLSNKQNSAWTSQSPSAAARQWLGKQVISSFLALRISCRIPLVQEPRKQWSPSSCQRVVNSSYHSCASVTNMQRRLFLRVVTTQKKHFASCLNVQQISKTNTSFAACNKLDGYQKLQHRIAVVIKSQRFHYTNVTSTISGPCHWSFIKRATPFQWAFG